MSYISSTNAQFEKSTQTRREAMIKAVDRKKFSWIPVLIMSIGAAICFAGLGMAINCIAHANTISTSSLVLLNLGAWTFVGGYIYHRLRNVNIKNSKITRCELSNLFDAVYDQYRVERRNILAEGNLGELCEPIERAKERLEILLTKYEHDQWSKEKDVINGQFLDSYLISENDFNYEKGKIPEATKLEDKDVMIQELNDRRDFSKCFEQVIEGHQDRKSCFGYRKSNHNRA